jgi:glycine cleavage system H protein
MSEQSELLFSKSHEWVRIDDDIATVGITAHAQEELGDVALILFPEVGRVLQADEKFGEIESIKAVSDLYSPIAGEVVAINEELEASPELVNDDPHGTGWLIQIRAFIPLDTSLLLSAEEYDELVREH